MSDEIKEILDYFRKYITINDCIKLNKIEDYITNLQVIEREYSNLLSENAELQQENDRLNNIINYIWQVFENGGFEDGCDCIEIYDYLKELKENNNE